MRLTDIGKRSVSDAMSAHEWECTKPDAWGQITRH